jgi:hypothetical protein
MNNHRCIFILLVVLLIGATSIACGSEDPGGGGSPGGGGGGETYSPPPPTAPTDCQDSKVSLTDAGSIQGVTLKRFTDPTRTTLLLTNSGSLSVVIFPPEDASTRLAASPYANPTDSASVAALDAVLAVANPNAVPGMPPGVSPNQVFFVPPGWSVCGTTGDVNRPAQARYLRDKTSSATNFAVRALAAPLFKRLTPSAVEKAQVLVTCAQDVVNLLHDRPSVSDPDLYVDVIGGETACRSSYKILLGDEAAAAETESRALTWLERSPQLLKNTKFFLALAHR